MIIRMNGREVQQRIIKLEEKEIQAIETARSIGVIALITFILSLLPNLYGIKEIILNHNVSDAFLHITTTIGG